MGQTNTERVQHDTTINLGRDDVLKQIVDDLLEEDSGLGYSETTYLSGNVGVDFIEYWDSPSKLKRRSTVTFSYSPFPFISTVVRQVYNEEGTGIIATATSTFTLNANKTVQKVTTAIVRS